MHIILILLQRCMTLMINIKQNIWRAQLQSTIKFLLYLYCRGHERCLSRLSVIGILCCTHSSFKKHWGAQMDGSLEKKKVLDSKYAFCEAFMRASWLQEVAQKEYFCSLESTNWVLEFLPCASFYMHAHHCWAVSKYNKIQFLWHCIASDFTKVHSCAKCSRRC